MAQDDIAELSDAIKQLRVAYDRYFLGVDRTEPIKARDDARRWLHRLVGEHSRNTARRFRLETLQATFITHEQHWTRISKQIEEGTYKRDKIRAQAILDAPASPAAGSSPRANATANANATGDTVTAELRTLHAAFIEARRSTGDARSLDLAALKATVDEQTARIKAQFNCREVEFKVAIKEGRAILKAVPKI